MAAPQHGVGTYWPALDGLRGVAVAAVLLFHGDAALLPGGFLGVSLFFTLSGFLITTLLVGERTSTGTIDLPAFWIRRARRLLPAVVLTLAGVVLFGALLADPGQLARLRGDVLAAFGYVANWRLLASGQSYADAFSQPSPVQHFWSLAIEEQFYLGFPLIAAGALTLGRGRRRLLTGVLLSLLVVSTAVMIGLHEPGADPSRVYYGTDARAAELLVGALLALVLSSRFRGHLLDTPIARRGVQAAASVGLVAVAATMWSIDQRSDWLYEGGLALFSLAAAALVAGAVLGTGPVAWLLSRAPLRGLGLISYGISLYHWPIFLWLSPGRTGWGPWPLLALRVAVTVAVAYASYRFVEQPIRRGQRLVYRRPALLVAGASAVAVILAVVVVTADPPPPPVLLATAQAEPPPPPSAPPSRSRAASSQEVAFVPVGDIGGPARVGLPRPVRVMVVGDSISWSLGLGLQRWGERTGNLLVWNTGTIGCGIGRGGEIRAPFNHCDDWATEWPRMLDEFEPQIVVVLDGAWDLFDRRFFDHEGWVGPEDQPYQRWLLSEYRRAVDVLTSRGATIAWLTTPCVVETDQAGTFAGTEVFEPERVRAVNTEVLPELNASRDDVVTMIDFYAWVCPQDTFTQRFGGVDGGRPDGLHFTEDAATVISECLGPKLMTSPPSP